MITVDIKYVRQTKSYLNKFTADENTVEINRHQCTGLGIALHSHWSKLVLINDAFGNSELYENGFRHQHAASELEIKLWIFNTYLTWFEFFQSGLYSALPFVAMWIFGMFMSVVSDTLVNKKILTIFGARKLANCIGDVNFNVKCVFLQ